MSETIIAGQVDLSFHKSGGVSNWSGKGRHFIAGLPIDFVAPPHGGTVSEETFDVPLGKLQSE